MTTYISIPVPEHLVPDVMAFIVLKNATPVSHSGGAANEAAGVAPVVNAVLAEQSVAPTGARLITPAEVPKVWSDSGAQMRLVLGYLAKRPGQRVSGDELAQRALGKQDRGHTIAGMMGAVGRRLKHRHGGRWPLEATWNAADKRWEYCMPAELACEFAKQR